MEKLTLKPTHFLLFSQYKLNHILSEKKLGNNTENVFKKLHRDSILKNKPVLFTFYKNNI
jgi:hypothetical protein